MGGGWSEPEASAEVFFNSVAPGYMNVGIDDSLLMFSGMDSTAHLMDYSSNLQSQIDIGKLPMYIEKIATVSKGFTTVPNAVGLGAFVIASILQMAFISVQGSSSGNSEPSPKDILERVFADEKARDVRDRVDEYLKSYRANLHDVQSLYYETLHQQRDLSFQITRLKNSMLKDKHMSSLAVKHWVNAAAFHVEMLIHIARLTSGPYIKSPSLHLNGKMRASSIIQTYQADMTTILEEYVKYKRSGFQLHSRTACYPEATCLDFCFFQDGEMPRREISDIYCKKPNDYYLDYIFSNNKQLEEIKHYFSDRNNNLEALVSQTGEFQIAIPRTLRCGVQ